MQGEPSLVHAAAEPTPSSTSEYARIYVGQLVERRHPDLRLGSSGDTATVLTIARNANVALFRPTTSPRVPTPGQDVLGSRTRKSARMSQPSRTLRLQRNRPDTRLNNPLSSPNRKRGQQTAIAPRATASYTSDVDRAANTAESGVGVVAVFFKPRSRRRPRHTPRPDPAQALDRDERQGRADRLAWLIADRQSPMRGRATCRGVAVAA